MLKFVFSFCRSLRQTQKYPSRCCPHSGPCAAGLREATHARLLGTAPVARARGSALRRPGAGSQSPPHGSLSPTTPRRGAKASCNPRQPHRTSSSLFPELTDNDRRVAMVTGKLLHSRESPALPHFRLLRPELVPKSPRFRSTTLPGAASLPPAGVSSRLSPDAAGAAWPAGRGGESGVGDLAILQTPAPRGPVLTSLLPLSSSQPPPPPLPLSSVPYS